jgi:hypothetical protein
LLRHLASNQQKMAQASDIDTVAKDLNLQK